METKKMSTLGISNNVKTKQYLLLTSVLLLSVLLLGVSPDNTDSLQQHQLTLFNYNRTSTKLKTEAGYSHNRIIIKLKEVYTDTFIHDAFQSIDALNRKYNVGSSGLRLTDSLFPLHHVK